MTIAQTTPLTVLTLTVAIFTFTQQACAKPGRSRERTIAGSITGTINNVIAGEFFGQRLPQVDVDITRRACKADDYASRNASPSGEALVAMYRRCKLTSTKFENAKIFVKADLPFGACEIIKTALRNVLTEKVFNVSQASKEHFEFSYKGAFYSAGFPTRETLRRANFALSCDIDGSIEAVTAY